MSEAGAGMGSRAVEKNESDDMQDEALEEAAQEKNRAVDDVLRRLTPEEKETLVRIVEGTEPSLEDKLRAVRQIFKGAVPEGLLDEEEMRLYVTLYGEPHRVGLYDEDVPELEEDVPRDILLRENGDGGLEEVEVEEVVPAEEADAELDDNALALELARDRRLEETAAEEEEDTVWAPRLHPLTLAGKFATFPTSVSLPKAEFIDPVTNFLLNFSNKHLSEAANNLFRGKGLPLSASTPSNATFKQVRNKSIALEASMSTMSSMEANAYLAVIMPGAYATIMSTLVEVRKRLGSKWLEGLLKKKGGPTILDAGAAGAGVLAWREVLKAEWATLHPNSSSDVPFGKSTVLTGSKELRLRSSELLENTTFIPRLPDYVHVRDSKTLDDDREPPQRKQFDLIIAPYTLVQMQEEYMRKEQVQKLWSLLNPDGGVLILIEKGAERGFEVIAGARDLLLERFIPSSTGDVETEEPNLLDETGRRTEKKSGMIIAPCTNHSKCPMYLKPGQLKKRPDFCHFQQRYIRPQFLQRVHEASSKNFEDIKFSYVAAQRGVDLRQSVGVVQGEAATEAAFASHVDPDILPEDLHFVPADFHTLSLPRTLLPSIKRKGHVILDVCTPAGKLERWTVPKSYGKQAFRDARKLQWGDLWALGAKTRVQKEARAGLSEQELAEHWDKRELMSNMKRRAKAPAGTSESTAPGRDRARKTVRKGEGQSQTKAEKAKAKMVRKKEGRKKEPRKKPSWT
jgi:ribosomal protein RSM22 (predicted rRNA methylase)